MDFIGYLPISPCNPFRFVDLLTPNILCKNLQCISSISFES